MTTARDRTTTPVEADSNSMKFWPMFRLSQDVELPQGRIAEVRYPLDPTKEECDLIVAAILRRREFCKA